MLDHNSHSFYVGMVYLQDIPVNGNPPGNRSRADGSGSGQSEKEGIRNAETMGNLGVVCTLLWSSIFVTLMANKIGGLQFGIYRNCQISSRVFHTAVAALPLTKANRSDFE